MRSTSKRTLFVIQPFTKGADEIYQLIASAASNAHLTTVRADAIEGVGSITDQIDKALSAASVIVADVSNASANVMYEVGVARARNKPLILVATSSPDIPSDLRRVSHGYLRALEPDGFRESPFNRHKARGEAAKAISRRAFSSGAKGQRFHQL